VRIGKIDIDRLMRQRDQLWAEAVALYNAGADWWITKQETQHEAERHQRERYIGDPWDDIIVSYLDGHSEVTIADVLRDSLHIDKARWTQMDHNRVARCLRAIGWRRVQIRTGDKRVWKYRKVVTTGDAEENDENVSPLKLVTAG